VNLVGILGRSKLKIPSSFRKHQEKLPTTYEKPLKMGFKFLTLCLST